MSANLAAEAALIRKTRLFDRKWYLEQYPDVGALGMNPLDHFLRFGVRMNRDPSPKFSCESYFEANRDLDPAVINPLVHYALWGKKEQRPLKPEPGQARRIYRGLKRNRGTILLVCHDSEIGGAQQVILTFAQWLISFTSYDVKLVTLQGGPWAERFRQTAATLDISELSENAAPRDVSRALHAWAGHDVRAVLLNSIASGGFLTHWKADTPVIAYVHELPKVLAMFPSEVDLIKQRASAIIGGSEAVRQALQDAGVDDERLRRAYSYIGDQSERPPVYTGVRRAAKLALGFGEDDFIVAGSGILNWRKAPQLFVKVAAKVVAEYGPKAKFMWIGSGNDLQVCQRLAADLGVGDNVRFTGIVDDITEHLTASDLFILPSVEDPFPLACLHAAEAGIPIVCFEDAGGMPEFTARGAGRAVPLKSVAAMSRATLDYARDIAARRRDGAAGKQLVDGEFTITTIGPQLLHYIRHAAGLSPRVSAIVPLPGDAASLAEGLRALDMQTFQDFEILLLGEPSDDASRALVDSLMRTRPGTRLIARRHDPRQPAAARSARGDLVWIGEAGHVPHPDLLRAFVQAFENPGVTCAAGRTITIDADWRFPRAYPGRQTMRQADRPVGPLREAASRGPIMVRRFIPDRGFVDPVSDLQASTDPAVVTQVMGGTIVACDGAFDFARMRPEP
jgi:glycosyltransferase involved in cell wall biosynthesis